MNPPDDAALNADRPTHAKGSSEESEERWLRAAVQNSSDMITVLDDNATIRYVSPAAERIIGYSPGELVGTVAFDYVHPEDIESLSNSFAEALENPGVMPPIEFRLRRADGSWRHVEVIRNIQLDNPALKGMVTITRDVTERQRSEEKLRQSEERLRRQYNSFPIPTFTFRYVQDDFELVDCNEAADRITLGRLRGLLGVRASEVYSDHPHILEMLSRCFSEGPTIRQEIPWRMRTTGEHKHFAVTFAHVPPDLVIHFAEDITERKRAEEEIRFQAKLLDAVGQAVITTDLQGKILYWNHAAASLYGWSEEEVMGRSILEVTPFEEMLDRAEEIMSGLMAGRSWSGEFTVRRKDGTSFPAMVTDTPVRDEQGNPVAIIGVSTDITEIKKTEELRRSEERFRSLVQNASDVITIADADGTILYDSPAVERVLGYKPEERAGTNAFDYIGPSESEQVTRMLGEILASPGARLTGEMWWPNKDGSLRYLEVSPTNLLEDPAVRGIVVNWRDITERKRAEEALRESEERFRLLVQGVKDYAIFMLDPEGRIATWNEGAERIKGYRAEEIIGEHFSRFYTEEDRERGHPEEELRIAAAEGRYEEEGLRVRKDGSRYWASVLITALRDEDGNLRGFSKVTRDITERKRAEERLHHQVSHDSLTELPNRKLFVDRLEQALRRTRRRRSGRKKVGVLFMDLDDFKVVNDSLGHEMGDRLLAAVGERLRGSLRPEDTLARFGGDEFTVLIEDAEDPADAVRVAERITGALREPFVLEGRELFLKPSIGIALGEARTTKPSAEALLRDADTAMYRAKEGGLVYTVFEPAMHERALRRLKMENELRRAVENKELVVCYQPIVDLRSDGEVKVWGLEALVRWRHPERGLLDPEAFVPAAEQSGLVVPMGERVLREACEQAKAWQGRHPHMPPLVMAVNLSARQLWRPDLARTVEGVLKETGLEARSLSLDITETLYIKALEGHTAALDDLKRLGVRLSIDDFGVGYSSLSYLKRLPADALKIDKSFVRALGEDAEDTVIVQTIVDLAHTFGMDVVAEGVESEAQAAQLKQMGCDLAQGYHFAQPLPPEAAEEFLAR